MQAFWAANFGREHILLELYHLGIDLNEPCERYGKDAEFVCGMRGNHSAVDRVNALRRRRDDLATKAQVNHSFRTFLCCSFYERVLISTVHGIRCNQARFRGYMCRKEAGAVRTKYRAAMALQKVVSYIGVP